jgi:hypothetical protein
MGFSGILLVVVYNPTGLCALWPGLGPRRRLSGPLHLSCGTFVGYAQTRSLKQREHLRLASGEDLQKLQLTLCCLSGSKTPSEGVFSATRHVGEGRWHSEPDAALS